MLELIPIKFYTPIFYNVILLIIIITILHTKSYSGFTNETFIFNKIFGFLLFWIVVIYMGFRPLSWTFGDMGMYAKKFDAYSLGWDTEITKDYIYYYFMYFTSIVGTKSLFFFSIAFFYVGSIYLATKRLFGSYHYFAFLFIISSFEFWSYGTNGIRNGVATSIVLLALAYLDKKWIMYLLLLLAFNLHSSVLIPIIAIIVTIFNNSTKLYYKIWIGSIFLSLFVGNQVESIIIGLGIMKEDTIQTYFMNKDLYASSFSQTGFRWDFLIYSTLPVISSYYFIHKKEINDEYYNRLTNIYLLSNSMWILVINASFSNRFAYLSWFMMGLVIIYPFLKQVFWDNQFKKIGYVTLFYFSFTYLMNFILPNI